MSNIPRNLSLLQALLKRQQRVGLSRSHHVNTPVTLDCRRLIKTNKQVGGVRAHHSQESVQPLPCGSELIRASPTPVAGHAKPEWLPAFRASHRVTASPVLREPKLRSLQAQPHRAGMRRDGWQRVLRRAENMIDRQPSSDNSSDCHCHYRSALSPARGDSQAKYFMSLPQAAAAASRGSAAFWLA